MHYLFLLQNSRSLSRDHLNNHLIIEKMLYQREKFDSITFEINNNFHRQNFYSTIQ